MSILIEKPAVFAVNKHYAPWPWLLSLGLHGLLLLLLLGFVQAGITGLQPTIQVSLLAPQPVFSQPSQDNAQVSQHNQAQPRRTTAARPAARQPAVTSRANSQPADNGDSVQAAQSASVPPVSSGNIAGPYESGQVDKAPVILQRVEPVYPQAARRRSIEGWVEIRFLVDHKGQVRQERIVQAQPSGVFENSALTALRAWRFSPGLLQGRAVDTWMVQVVRFRLASG